MIKIKKGIKALLGGIITLITIELIPYLIGGIEKLYPLNRIIIGPIMYWSLIEWIIPLIVAWLIYKYWK